MAFGGQTTLCRNMRSKMIISLMLSWAILGTATDLTEPCTMCESADAVLANPDKIVPFLGDAGQLRPTCQQIFDFAVNVTTVETCQLVQGQAAFCGCPETSGDPINACSFCPDGPDSLPGAPDYVTPSGDTCAELYEYVSFMPQTECNKFERSDRILKNNWLCKCPNPIVECSLCPDGTFDLENPDLVIPFFAIPSNDRPTCAEARDFASVSNVERCKFYHYHAGYCGCPTTRSGTADPLNICTLCPDGSDPANPDFILQQTSDTCSDLQTYISYFDEERCDSDTANLISGAAFVCGCPSVEPSCQLCLGGSKVVDPDADSGSGNRTCGEFESLVLVQPENLCANRQQIIEQVREDCCGSGANSLGKWLVLGLSVVVSGVL